MKVVECLVRQRSDVIEEVRALCSHALHIGILVLHHACHDRIVHCPELGDPAPLLAVDDPLGWRRRVDDVVGRAEVRRDQFALGQHERLDQVGGKKPVLADDAGRERQFRDAMRDDIEIRHMLRVLCEYLEEAGVIDTVVIIVPGVDV